MKRRGRAMYSLPGQTFAGVVAKNVRMDGASVAWEIYHSRDPW